MTGTKNEEPTREYSKQEKKEIWREYLRKLQDRNTKQVEIFFHVSVDYAKNFLKYCLILNGSSILAFPTFIQITNIDLDSNKIGFITTITLFCVGIFFSMMSMISASNWFNFKMERNSITIQTIDTIIPPYLTEEKYDREIKKFDEERLYLNNLSYRWSQITIFLGALSIFSFMFGAVLGALVVTEFYPWPLSSENHLSGHYKVSY